MSVPGRDYERLLVDLPTIGSADLGRVALPRRGGIMRCPIGSRSSRTPPAVQVGQFGLSEVCDPVPAIWDMVGRSRSA